MPMTPEERESLARVDERTEAMQKTLGDLSAKFDTYATTQTRHDEQIKLIQRGGGSALTLVLTIVAALIKDRLHL